MPAISVQVQGLEQLGANLHEMGLGAQMALEVAALAGALPIVNRWKTLMYESGASPPPSEPGEPPHVETGTYARSIHPETVLVIPGLVQVGIGSDISDPPYPEYLEFGTSRMEARPAARPAFDEAGQEAIQEMVYILAAYYARFGEANRTAQAEMSVT